MVAALLMWHVEVGAGGPAAWVGAVDDNPGMFERIRRTWSTSGLTAEGWSGVAIEVTPWTATVVATWRPQSTDWGRFAATVSLAAFAFLVAFLWRDRGDFSLLVPGAVGVFLAWDAVRQLRSRRPASEITLVLGPEALELSSSESGVPAVRLPRDRAGWLVAAEMQTDWHLRHIWLLDAADREVARFVGSLAVVEVRRPGLPPATMLPAVVPVAVLLGQWWPHQARRISRTGSAGLRFRWREPDLGAFPRHERRQRVVWSAFYGVFAVGCFWAALAGSSAEWVRLLFGLAGVGLVVWRVNVLRWRPTFLQMT